MLPITTVRKLMSECFPQTGDIISVKPKSRQAWFKKLVEHVQKHERIESRFWALDEKKTDFILGLYIKGVDNGRNPNDYFKLHFETHDELEGLWIFDSKQRKGKIKLAPAPVSNIAQIDQLIERVKDQQERNNLRDQRKQKVANLQQTGLTARLKELGTEHNFCFAMSQNKRDVKLSIRIEGRKRGFHFTFPKGKLGAVIEEVPNLIATLKNLQALGVNFRSESRQWIQDHRDKWIDPPKSTVNAPKSKTARDSAKTK